MKKIILHFFLITLLCISTCLCAQENLVKKNAVYGEFFGNAQTLFSINYERLARIGKGDLIHFTFRIGYSSTTNNFDSTFVYIFPVEFNCLLGKDKHFVETGIGCSNYFGTSDFKSPLIPIGYKSNFEPIFTLRLGYRFIDDGKIVARLAPLFTLEQNPPQSNRLKLGWTVGASLGYCFNFKRGE